MRIPRQNLLTFASEAGKHKPKKQIKWCNEVVTACLVRDLFGCIRYHSLQQNIDMAEVLEYSLTPVPLSLSHVDGTMQKTHKATLIKPLESEVTVTPPSSINTTIIDASFVLHLQTSSSLPPSFGAIALILLQKVMYAEGDVIHFVTDKWLSPSIKDCERDSRMSSSKCLQYHWSISETPEKLESTLRNTHLKESLIEFLRPLYGGGGGTYIRDLTKPSRPDIL